MDHFIGTLDAEEVAQTIYGEVTPETLGLASRGNGCMAEYRRGRGAVFNAGSRDESAEQQGVAHALRVYSSLATKNFSVFGLSRNLDQVGAQLR